ncbi:ABC transporter substrate-binding protein [Halomonas sp. GXIMD04776]|uniref:ABC transporter substrate-binding protein n=1 Tax=Halomonas sp. GXIMD04776 TaxID=3415605 RepID=UPI003CB8A2FF
MIGTTLLSLATIFPAQAADSRIVTLDWTVAETLLALDVVPQGVAQIDAYRDWVGTPALPPSVMDLGLRAQPNLELLASLDPAHILITPLFAALESRLSRIAPVTTLGIYASGDDPWSGMLAATRELGELVDRPEAAERLIKTTNAHLAKAKRHLPENLPPLLLVQFMDARHVRVFGDRSLYQGVLAHLGLDNAWKRPTNAYGFSLVGLEALANLDAHLVVVEPLPVGVETQLNENGLWQNLSAVREQRVSTLPPVWSFGGLPSARRFATLLVEALTRTERAADA